MSITLMDTDRMSRVYYQPHAEPNIYFQPQFKSGAAGYNRSLAGHQNSRDETSEENNNITIQQRDIVKIIDEQLKKQMKKIKMVLIVAVSVIGIFLALAIGLSFLATIHSHKQLQLSDIEKEVNKHVAPLQGNLTALNNQLIDIHGKQFNGYVQLAQQMNEYVQQTESLNNITEVICNDLAEYVQRTERMSDSINQNQVTIEQMRNNYYSINIHVPTIKTMYIEVSSHPLQVSFRQQNPSTFAVHGLISQLFIPNTSSEYTSVDSIIAYRPRYNDLHNSDLAILFFNLEAAFPCLRGPMPACSLFTHEEGGFLRGRPLIQAADAGNNLRIFGFWVMTFGFGFAECNTFANWCVPNNFELSLVCLLPHNDCTY